MFKLLLLLLLFVFLYPIVKGWMAFGRVRRTMRDAMGAARQVDEPVEEGRRLVFGDDDGVYADYEDVATPRDTAAEPAPESSHEAGQQIVDADFEDIP